MTALTETTDPPAVIVLILAIATTTTEAQTATQTSALDIAVGLPAIAATEATEIGIGAVTALRTSTVPMPRVALERTLCPSGLLRRTLPIYPSKMLNMIKVLRLSEESMGLSFRSQARMRKVPHRMVNLSRIRTGIHRQPWMKRQRKRQRFNDADGRERQH
jgi:hypothetical protein